jgi:hypothetical protein
MSASDAASWQELPDDDELMASPPGVTHTPVDPQLELLPTPEMTWPNFERLLARVAREVEGLRTVRLYGVSGQAQEGIDLVGINPAGQNEAVQGKKTRNLLSQISIRRSGSTLTGRFRSLFVG